MKLAELIALYSPLDIEYNEALSGPYIDLSEYDGDNEIVVGMKEGKLSGFWRPIVAVGSEKFLKAQCERLWLISDDWYYLDFLIDGELSVVSKFLLKHGYRAKPVYTQMIDLTQTVRQLHLGLRKSYKSLVNKKEGIHSISIKEFQELHERVKEKKRPQETWDIQAKMKHAISRQGDCAVMFYQNEDGTAYYASAVGDNVHALIWHAIEKFNNFCFKLVELGEQVYFPGQIMQDGKPATEKNVNISHFKAGFGGKTSTRLILDKPHS